MFSTWWRKSGVFILCVIVFAFTGCNSEGEKPDGSSANWSSPETVIGADVTKLEEANSLEYVLKKETATIFNNETYYEETIISSQDIFSPRCRYWIQEDIYPDYDENVRPGKKFEFYALNDGSTLERGMKSDGKWTAQLPVTGEFAQNNLELDHAIWKSYWYILNENIASLTGPPVEGWINDTQTVSYFGSISPESTKEAFKEYYENQPLWKDPDNPYKMLSGVPSMTLIDNPVPIIITFNKETALPIQIDLDTTEIEKEIIKQSMQIAGGQSQSNENLADIVETHLIYAIKGIDTLNQIKEPEGLKLENQSIY